MTPTQAPPTPTTGSPRPVLGERPAWLDVTRAIEDLALRTRAT